MDNQQNGLANGSVFAAPSTTRIAELGRKVEFSDGRCFKYVLSGGTLLAGGIVSQPAATALLTNKLAVAAIGATSVVLTLAAITANQFRDGMLHLTDDTGAGYSYKIKSNTASDTTIDIELYEGLIVAIDATTDCMLTPELDNGVLAGIAAAKPCGVALQGASSGEYLWIQTKGVATVIVKTTTNIVAGSALMAGANSGVLLHTAAFPICAIALGAFDDFMAVDLCMS